MTKQKNPQSLSPSRQASLKQKLASNSGNNHQQSSGIKLAGGSQNTANHVLTPILQKSTPPSQEEEVTKATILLFEHIEDQINRADTKAQLTLAADALLAGTLATLGKGTGKSLLSNTSPFLDRFADLFTILMFLALVCSFYWALRVINPHLRSSKRLTLMYFGRIAQMNEDDFINTFGNQSLRDLKESTLSQVHTKAKIAQVKFARARWSVNFLLLALVFWSVIQLLLAFS
jgi:hypothetical protein